MTTTHGAAVRAGFSALDALWPRRTEKVVLRGRRDEDAPHRNCKVGDYGGVVEWVGPVCSQDCVDEVAPSLDGLEPAADQGLESAETAHGAVPRPLCCSYLRDRPLPASRPAVDGDQPDRGRRLSILSSRAGSQQGCPRRTAKTARALAATRHPSRPARIPLGRRAEERIRHVRSSRESGLPPVDPLSPLLVGYRYGLRFEQPLQGDCQSQPC
jgi:hypothetical protein